MAKPAACGYFVRLLRAALALPSPLRSGSVQIEETELPADAVQRPTSIVTGHSTNLLRSFRLMPARTVRCGSLSLAASLCMAWLIAAPVALGQTSKKASTDIQPGDVTPDTGDKDKTLPAGLIQNRQVLPEMEIDKELYTDGQETEFTRKSKTAFEKALGSGALTDDEKKLIDTGAKYWIYRFTMKKYREEEAPKKEDRPAVGVAKTTTPKERLPDLRKKVLDLVKLYAKTPVAREYLLKQLTERCGELLDNNFVVRQNIILLLGTLSTSYPPPGKQTEPTPYDPAYAVLLKVIKDDKQHEILKVDAIIGLLRICKLGLPLPDANNDKKRAEIAIALVPELARKNTHWWYQARLAECLGAASVTYDPGNKSNPLILQTLAEVVADDQHDFQARIEAAKAIGRLPLDNQLNIAPVVHHIVNLGHQIVQANNANSKKQPWGNYFFTPQPQLGFGLYYAFRSESGSARVPGGKRKPGLLEALPATKEVKDAYEQILLMTLHFIDNPGKQMAETQVKGIQEWLRLRVPANNRITAGSPPLGSKPPEQPASQKGATPASSPAGGSALP